MALALQSLSLSPEMEAPVLAVERIVGYSLRNKRLLEAALTHPSYTYPDNYQRLEFVGDAALGLALTNYFFLTCPNLDPGQLSLLRAANISTEKLARVAIKHGLFKYVRHNVHSLDDKIGEFIDAVKEEDDVVIHAGSVKAPKVLADIVESVAAAIYVDVDFDLERLWVIFRGLLEPIAMPEHLQQQPQPVALLFELCQKHGKQVDIKHWKKGLVSIVSVFVDGELIASGSSEQKEIAKLNVAKSAIHKLSESLPTSSGMTEYVIDKNGFLQGAKQKLHDLCCKKKWSKPNYKIEKDVGPQHDKKFVCSVNFATASGVLYYMIGDEKTRVKDAENSAATLMMRALLELKIL
ncbi:hypothetical protein K2173_015338 [Erythroxylum novogranatense]|uniref:Uncharacterized protein n=1 Tax=Erythroxylum novogranatense TaxID=1862640 RepID=A0AAV8SRD9_9ROSI|nr:hypothetical protein K2173_015338 [Erythroxylum novogranatense]